MIAEVLHKIVSHPQVYDLVQKAVGGDAVTSFLSPHFAETAGHSLLEVGAGTGNCRILMPDSTRYLWLDHDVQKLSGFRKKHPNELAVMGDGTQLCFKDKSVDYALCAAVLHHLNDAELALLLNELQRVVRRRLIVLDPVDCQDRTMSNLLWKYDRGSFPRTTQRIQTILERQFNLDHTDELTVNHRYVLCVASPKN